jgi:catechol 2,3-dioxygenase-like lactoylglutathione lyase family enzyme
MNPSALLHLAVTVPDLEKSVRFYTEVLGFVAAPDVFRGGGPDHPADGRLNGLADLGENPRLVGRFLCKGTFFLELVQLETGEYGPQRIPMKHYAYEHLAFRVDDVEKTLKLAEQFGGTVLPKRRVSVATTVDVPITIAFCTDPSGNELEIIEHKSQELADKQSESLHLKALGWGALPPSIG